MSKSIRDQINKHTHDLKNKLVTVTWSISEDAGITPEDVKKAVREMEESILSIEELARQIS